MLGNCGGDGIVRTRLIPVAIRPRPSQQAIDQNARPRTLIAIHHQARRITQRRADGFFGTASLKSFVTGAKHDALHPPIARHQLKTLNKKGCVVSIRLFVEQMDRRKIALATPRCR